VVQPDLESGMSEFDPVRALKEEISGMSDIARLVSTQARQSEAQLAEIEAKHNALLKLDAFVKELLGSMHERLRAMETEIERKAGG
jgi:hypothetical protein